MKRKATARCAAANDEEDLCTFFDEPHAMAVVDSVKRRRGREVNAGESPIDRPRADDSTAPEVAKSKKEKEFAWMDSDDEQEPETVVEDVEAVEANLEGSDEAEDTKITVEVLEEVQSFGRMILLAPALQNWLRSGDSTEVGVAAACRAMARTKFFDGEILEDLYDVLRKMLHSGKFDVTQTNDAIQCFWTLNAYERSVFSAIANAFRGKTAFMETGLRSEWLQIFKAFGHECEKDFLQVLDVPQALPTSPTFRKIRCWYFAKGCCSVGEVCTFLHDMRAPLSLEHAGDFMRVKPTVMTADQESLGKGTYGTSRGVLPVTSTPGLNALLGASPASAHGNYFFSG